MSAPACTLPTGCACPNICGGEGACYMGAIKARVLRLIPGAGAGAGPGGVQSVIAVTAAADCPDDNPKTAVGAKKPAMSAVPPVALLHIGQAMADGARKYGAFNYREKTVSATTYYNAVMRHLLAWLDGENEAEDSGVHHLAHVMACCAILIDAESVGRLNDDRPKVTGAAGLWIKEHST